MAKFFRLLVNAVISVVIVMLLAVFLLPRVFGYQPYMVVSASMQQSFPVGSLIFVKAALPEQISVGDPITFTSGTMTITHRVIAIDSEHRRFTTKGDNNNTSETVPFENLKGKALNVSIPYLGYFSAWFITVQGKVTTILTIAALALLSMTLGRLAEIDQDETKAGES